MNNRHASHLPIGARIRRKGVADPTIYIVEQIELTKGDRKKNVAVRAGGRAFRAWEIERACPVKRWPKEPVS